MDSKQEVSRYRVVVTGEDGEKDVRLFDSLDLALADVNELAGAEKGVKPSAADLARLEHDRSGRWCVYVAPARLSIEVDREPIDETDAASYNVQIRETGTSRHKLLADGYLTTKRIHAIQFSDAEKAAEACQWLIANNPGAIDSARVIDADTRAVVEKVGLIRRVEPPSDGDRFAGLRQRRAERGLSVGRVITDGDYEALLWVAEGWSDDPLPDLGVLADPADDPETARREAEQRMKDARDDLSERLVCRTMGANLHMNRAEMLALLGHMQEPDGGAVIRRRLEVLLGEKTLGQVDDEAERERTMRRVEPLSEGAYRVLCGLVQPSDVVDPFDVTGPDAAWEQLRRIFPAADASTIDTE